MKSVQHGRFPSFHEISGAISPIEAVGISYEDMRIRITDTGKLSIEIPKELVVADREEQAKIASSRYRRPVEGHPTIALLSYAERIADDGGKHQIEDKNNPGCSVELNAGTVVAFLNAIEERKVILFPPPTSYEQRRLNAVKRGIIDLGISRLSQ